MDGTGVTPKQARAIAALLTERSITQAAQVAGVSSRQIYRWFKSATFCAMLQAAKTEHVQHAGRRLAGALGESITQVLHLMQFAEDEPTRLRAALSVPDMLIQLDEHSDVRQRLAELEARVKSLGAQ